MAGPFPLCHPTHCPMRSQPLLSLTGSRLPSVAVYLVVLLWQSTLTHAQRDLTEIPEPDPAAELAAMRVADGAEVQLFAADPEIRKPIQVNFDSRGRLWVASSEVYPQIEPGQVADDKIIVLEDTNGDGTADKSTVFARGLLIPTGVVPDEQGGAYVAASSELLHLVDTTGDGVADQRRVVFSGFGTEDTHHLIHTLRWGPDGCLYFNQSIYIHSHIETAYGTRHLDGGGIWRYRPSTGRLEVFCRGFVNPWGHAFDADGESFVTDGAYFEGINYVFPHSVFVTAPGATRWLGGMNPGSPKHCGLEVISGSHFPASWWGDLVTSDFRGHRVCRFTIRRSGSGYSSSQQSEVLTSRHVAFRPIDARMGLDGALYVADWYNPIIQHGEVDFRDQRRDRKRGRIWRVHFPDSPLDTCPDLAAASDEQLLALLEDRSLVVRQFARQHLWPRLLDDPPRLLDLATRWRDESTDPARRARRALEQQWLGEVAGTFSEGAFQVIADAQPGPRSRVSLRSAVRTAGVNHPSVAPRLTAAVIGDHESSRLEAVVALGQTAPGGAAVEASETLILLADSQGGSVDDPRLDFALWQSLRQLSGSWIEALREDRLRWQQHADGLAYAVSAAASVAAADAVLPLLTDTQIGAVAKRKLVTAIAASGAPAALGRLLDAAFEGESADPLDPLATETLRQLVQRTQRDRAIPDGAAQRLVERFGSTDALPHDAEDRAVVLAAAGWWRAEPMLPLLVELADQTSDLATQHAAIAALGNFDREDAAEVLARWAQRPADAGHAETAIEATLALVNHRGGRAAELAVELLGRVDDDAAATRLLLSLRPNQEVAAKVAERLSDSELPRQRAEALLVAVRGAGGSETLEAALQAAGRLDRIGWQPTEALAAEILQAAGDHGDPHRGEAIYRRDKLQCVNCHGIGEGGSVVGPNLISLGASSQPDYILESLWLPDAKLKEGYNTINVLTDDGRVTAGIPFGRSDAALQLRLADGREVEIATATIEAQQPGKSLMPEGLVDSLTKQELVDLVAFLSALGRDPEFTVSTDAVVRDFETLEFSPQANRRLNRTSTDAVAAEDPVFHWRPITTRVSGTLPLEELDTFRQHRSTPPLSFVRFDLEVARGHAAPRLELPVEGVDVWVDGQPTPPEQVNQLDLKPSRYRIVLGINRQRFEGPLRVVVDRP